jgi:hypothetical protein
MPGFQPCHYRMEAMRASRHSPKGFIFTANA